MPNPGETLHFEIHNANAYADGAAVEVQDAAGNNLLTLLGQENVPLVSNWRLDGSGTLRSNGRVPRTLEVAGGHIAVNDVFCPMFVYPKNTSMTPDSVRVIDYQLNVVLWQDILVEYAA